MAKFNSLNIGDTVRVVSLADTGDRCGAPSTLNDYIGGTFEVTELSRQLSTNLGRVKLSNGWWFSPKGLEVLTPTEPPVTAPPTGGELVTPDTPVGTTVVYIGGDEGSAAPVGVPLELKRHDGDSRPRVEVIGSEFEYADYYPEYKYLRIQAVPSTPEVAKVHTSDAFKYTRVRVKGTESEGVVVGRSRYGRGVAVLHDETAPRRHGGNTYEVDFVGVPERTWYYPASDLEIIGGVQ